MTFIRRACLMLVASFTFVASSAHARTVVNATPASAHQNAIHTPAVGSPERRAILTALRTDPSLRFTFRTFHVYRTGQRAIAYVKADNGVTGEFQMILVRHGRGPWRSVWGEGNGGSDSCARGARHFAWALSLIRSYHVQPDQLFPNLTATVSDLQRRAARDPELQCVGDLEGGPDAATAEN